MSINDENPIVNAIQVKPVREQIIDLLRTLIYKGVYQPGQELRQELLAQQLGVSRMPVREALLALETENLVELRPHRGAVVMPIDESFITDYYDMRIMLEGEAAYLACPHLTAEDDLYLKHHLEQETEAFTSSDHTALRKLNADLHRFIWEHSHNQRLIKTMNQYYNMSPSSCYKPVMNQNTFAKNVFSQHNEIIRELLSRDADAARNAMRRHEDASKQRTLALYRQQQDENGKASTFSHESR